MSTDGFFDYSKSVCVDYQDPEQIVDHLRALLDLYDLLGREGYDAEFQAFLVKLRIAEWGSARIAGFIQQSSFHTRWEGLIDPPIPSRGDSLEFENNKYRVH